MTDTAHNNAAPQDNVQNNPDKDADNEASSSKQDLEIVEGEKAPLLTAGADDLLREEAKPAGELRNSSWAWPAVTNSAWMSKAVVN